MSSQITSGQEKIDFEHLGIGTVLQRNRLVVPINQRNYAWEDKQVKDLFRDFSKAISEGKRSYFLGTIVLTTGDQSPSPEVTDGQQRLSTSTMLLAAIRDYLVTRSDDDLVNYIETEFLYKFDPDAREIKPRLTLNADDHEFFRARVLERPGKADRVRAERQAARDELRRDSHKKIARAAELATSHVQNIIAQHSERNRAPELMAWVKYIEHVFQVILLKVPDELNAFVMFETLNDRGLRTTQLDLVKNYLFRQVGNERAKEAHWKWSSMIGVLESTGVDDIAITYLRHLVNSLYGLTRERRSMKKSRPPWRAVGRRCRF